MSDTLIKQIMHMSMLATNFTILFVYITKMLTLMLVRPMRALPNFIGLFKCSIGSNILEHIENYKNKTYYIYSKFCHTFCVTGTSMHVF